MIGAELEFMRCQPRKALTTMLRDYDLVQVVSGSPAWALAARDCGKPVCLAVATLTAVERAALLEKGRGARIAWTRCMTRIMQQLDDRALRVAAVVFVINHWMEAHIAGRIGHERVVFAPPGVDTGFFRPPDRQSKRHYILAVGRLADPRKNVSLLFAAYALLLQGTSSAPDLILAGATMPGETELKLAQELGVRHRIRMFAAITGEQLRDLYQDAAMLVLSSDEEGLGIVILEAMACGVPVVATRCGGPETVVVDGETGILTPVGDAPTLAAAMKEILSDLHRLESMGSAARDTVTRAFSLDAAFAPYLCAYNRLLDNRNAPDPP
jgi:glycosyltransferase involved in cell wall biosynthesis